MTLLDVGQDTGRLLQAVDVIAAVQWRLQEAGTEAAAEALYHFHRLSPDELLLLVELEVGVRHAGVRSSGPQDESATVAA